jgi:hypothetical protein
MAVPSMLHHLLLTLTLAAALAPLHGARAAAPESAATARAPRSERIEQCSWNRPGHNPFMGEVVPAIDRYIDIPTPVRQRLKERMQARRYDDIVEIRRDTIRGKADYRPEIRDMHFGWDRVCREVTRSAWNESMRERGLVYCDSGHCILVPTVCRNVSRIERQPSRVAAAPQALSSEAIESDPAAGGAPGVAGDGGDAPPAVTPISSSFAEVVAGVTLPLWPVGEPSDSGGGAIPPGLGGGFPSGPGSAGSPGGGHSGPGGGVSPPVAVGGGELPPTDPGPPLIETPVAPLPEPATWASLFAGLALLVLAERRRQRRTGAPRCATQKRS